MTSPPDTALFGVVDGHSGAEASVDYRSATIWNRWNFKYISRLTITGQGSLHPGDPRSSEEKRVFGTDGHFPILIGSFQSLIESSLKYDKIIFKT